MQLYLLRHGAAEARALTGGDANRQLTAEGAAEVLRQMRRAAKKGVQASLILSSPYLRAIATAEIAARELACTEPILRSPALRPDSSPADLWSEVRFHADRPSLLIVSHEPLLSTALAWLQGITTTPPPFPSAALARLDLETFGPVPHAAVTWLLPPSDS